MTHANEQFYQSSWETGAIVEAVVEFFGKASSSFGYQCLDNVMMYLYTKFDQNIPYIVSRVMSIFTKRGLTTAEPRHHFCIPVTVQIK